MSDWHGVGLGHASDGTGPGACPVFSGSDPGSDTSQQIDNRCSEKPPLSRVLLGGTRSGDPEKLISLSIENYVKMK